MINLHKVAVFLLTVIIVVILVYYQDMTDTVLMIGAYDLLALGILTYATVIISAYVFSVLLKTQNIGLNFRENIHLSVLTQALNYLGPLRAGMIARAFYLKRKYDLPYGKYTSVAVVSAAISIMILSIISLIMLIFYAGIVSSPFTVAICGLLILVVTLFWLANHEAPRLLNQWGKIGEYILSVREGIVTIPGFQYNLILEMGFILLQLVVSAYIYMYAFEILGTPMTFTSALLIGVLTSISNLVSLTPGNIGIQEFVIATISEILGSGFVTGAAVATILRTIHIVLVGTHLPWSMAALNIEKSDLINTKTN